LRGGDLHQGTGVQGTLASPPVPQVPSTGCLLSFLPDKLRRE
jgi:hypothetical protein